MSPLPEFKAGVRRRLPRRLPIDIERQLALMSQGFDPIHGFDARCAEAIEQLDIPACEFSEDGAIKRVHDAKSAGPNVGIESTNHPPPPSDDDGEIGDELLRRRWIIKDGDHTEAIADRTWVVGRSKGCEKGADGTLFFGVASACIKNDDLASRSSWSTTDGASIRAPGSNLSPSSSAMTLGPVASISRLFDIDGQRPVTSAE